jgi:hypothetical protein
LFQQEWDKIFGGPQDHNDSHQDPTSRERQQILAKIDELEKSYWYLQDA